MVLHSSPQEDDVWKSQWPGAVHQRIWTRAWCQKIKRFALLFLSISVNICRAALFPAAVKIGKCLTLSRSVLSQIEMLWGLACTEAKPHLWPSFLSKFCFSGPAGLGGAWAACGSWSCRWNLAGMEASAAELVIKPSKLWSWDETETAALHMLPTQAGTCCWCCFSALGKAQCPNGSRQSLVFPATPPCPEYQQSKPFRGWQESALYLTLLTLAVFISTRVHVFTSNEEMGSRKHRWGVSPFTFSLWLHTLEK